MPIKNEIGNRYGKLVVIEQRGYIGKDAAWICQCDCGNFSRTRGTSLRRGAVKSCGCLVTEHGNGHRLPDGEGAFNGYYYKTRHGAELRGYEWELSKEQVKEINSKDCFYCGQHPSHIHLKGKSTGKYIYNGIDRIDNTKGYTIDNVVPCCGKCNRMKNKYSLNEFKDAVTKIYKHFIQS